MVAARLGATYSAVHHELKRLRGNANEHTCVCGAPARDWAYLGGDPEECTDPRDGAYSLDLERYAPMCRSCHRRMDAASAITECPHGHRYTPENVYIDPVSGARRCRKCKKDRDASLTPAQKARRAQLARARRSSRRLKKSPT